MLRGECDLEWLNYASRRLAVTNRMVYLTSFAYVVICFWLYTPFVTTLIISMNAWYDYVIHSCWLYTLTTDHETSVEYTEDPRSFASGSDRKILPAEITLDRAQIRKIKEHWKNIWSMLIKSPKKNMLQSLNNRKNTSTKKYYLHMKKTRC